MLLLYTRIIYMYPAFNFLSISSPQSQTEAKNAPLLGKQQLYSKAGASSAIPQNSLSPSYSAAVKVFHPWPIKKSTNKIRKSKKPKPNVAPGILAPAFYPSDNNSSGQNHLQTNVLPVWLPTEDICLTSQSNTNNFISTQFQMKTLSLDESCLYSQRFHEIPSPTNPYNQGGLLLKITFLSDFPYHIYVLYYRIRFKSLSGISFAKPSI